MKIAIIITILLTVLFLCGCSEKEVLSDNNLNTEFLGTWTGNIKYSANKDISNFNFSKNSNFTNKTNKQDFSSANITQLEFNEDTVELTISTENKTMAMSNSYVIEDNQLILSKEFQGQKREGTQPPEGKEKPSMTTKYIYSFNEDKTILYLNENPFYKI